MAEDRLGGARQSEKNHQVAVLLVAAGRGVRAGGGLPKQYRSVGGQPVLRRSVSALLALPAIGRVMCIIHPDDASLYAMAVDGLSDQRLLPAVAGGATRQASVLAGLEALEASDCTHVLVHDAVRPFASPALFARVIDALREAKGAIAALAVTDTLKRTGAGGGTVQATVDRSDLWAAQTPQGFDYGTLISAHQAARAQGRSDFTDDAALLEWRGERVVVVAGESDNFKITTPADFQRAEAVVGAGARIVRTGLGYDVHAFTQGDHVTIGGVKITHDRGILAHSDGDVVLHALTDAVLGALCEGDIGRHFPPSDEKWRHASSDQFLRFAAERVRQAGGDIVNLDATLIAEAPRVGPHREAIRAAIAAAAAIPLDAVSIKATTSEKLGFIGRQDGLAAMALATITLPAKG